MTIGASLFLIAVGAILRFAVSTVRTHGIDLHTIGDILMIIGVVGLLLWLFLWGPWARGRRSSMRRPPQDVEPAPDAYRPGTTDGRYPPGEYRPRDYAPGEYRTEEFPAGEYPTQPEVRRDMRRGG